MSIRDFIDPFRFAQRFIFNHRDDGKLPPAVENQCCEAYNDGSEDIVFKSIHPEKHRMHFFGKPPTFWEQFECKPGEWVFLPHLMYTGETKSGSPCKVVWNFGNAKFKGNKLPSRPEVKTRFKTKNSKSLIT